MPVKRTCLILLLGLCFCATALGQSAEEHSGKPILRGDAVAASPSATGGTPSPVDLDSGRVALALTSVVCLIFLLRWAVKKAFPASVAVSRQHAVKVLARCPLAPRQQVILLQVGRRIVVAAESAGQLSSLCQITDADEVAALLGDLQRDKSTPAVSSFTSWFARSTQAFAEEDGEPSPQAMETPPASQIEGLGLGSLTARVRQITREFKARHTTP
jgi:flagellar biogenesis protein FliO